MGDRCECIASHRAAARVSGSKSLSRSTNNRIFRFISSVTQQLESIYQDKNALDSVRARLEKQRNKKSNSSQTSQKVDETSEAKPSNEVKSSKDKEKRSKKRKRDDEQAEDEVELEHKRKKTKVKRRKKEQEEKGNSSDEEVMSVNEDR